MVRDTRRIWQALFMLVAMMAGMLCFGMRTEASVLNGGVQEIWRLYNPNSGEHFYTANDAEHNMLTGIGWHDESVGWYSPVDGGGSPLYRVYNPNSGEHFYTLSPAEKQMLVSAGWNDEGVAYQIHTELTQDTTPIYRLFNPNAGGDNPGSHHYTTNAGERDTLVGLGWRDEGVMGYGSAF